jgi:S1-C subfamily serine protease
VPINLILSLFLFLFVNVTQAEIYRWVDESGKVHFGSDYDSKNKKASKKVTIRDKYVIPLVTVKEPNEYSLSKENRQISISNITLDMANSENENVRIGRMTCGRYPVDLYWTDGVSDLKARDIGGVISNTFNKLGYSTENAIGSIPAAGNLILKAKIKDLKITFCANKKDKTRAKASSLVDVDWVLYDPISDEELLVYKTRGSHVGINGSFIKEGTKKSLENTFAAATKNLLANTEFTDYIFPVDLSEMKEKFDDEIDVEYEIGSGSGRFSLVADNVKKNSVTIKTKNGHGSGVFINDEGYILTNAHVVGDEKDLIVIFEDQEYNAILVRKERIRDVALVKVKDYIFGADGVKISNEKPNIGDNLYVIGSPLKIELKHTVTKGIVSANRTLNGQDFIQTDAAINRGNSGGAVFNDSGELVALTVAGVFTNTGASLNINYLIPIDDAILTLNIKSKSVIGEISKKMKDKSVVEVIKIALKEIDVWLDKPLLSLY